jgi:hypothetical protein
VLERKPQREDALHRIYGQTQHKTLAAKRGERSGVAIKGRVGGTEGRRIAPRGQRFSASAYSPDLNPIEQFFSKLKAVLRKAAERTIPRLCRKIRSLLRTVSADKCLNLFRHSGYGWEALRYESSIPCPIWKWAHEQ